MFCDHEDAPCCGCSNEMSSYEHEYQDYEDARDYPSDAAIQWNCDHGDHGDTDAVRAGWECVHCGHIRPYEEDERCNELEAFRTPDGMETYSGYCGLEIAHTGAHGCWQDLGQ